MVYTSSNVRAMSKSHQITSKHSTNENTVMAKNRSQSTNMHFHQRRNVSLPQEQHPVAQNSRQKVQPQQHQHQQYYHYHQQPYYGGGQRHDANVSRQLMSLPAKPPTDVDNNVRRHSKSMAGNDGNGNADSSCIDEYSSDDDLHYNSNRSILNHHNCQTADDIYMDALSEVGIESE